MILLVSAAAGGGLLAYFGAMQAAAESTERTSWHLVPALFIASLGICIMAFATFQLGAGMN